MALPFVRMPVIKTDDSLNALDIAVLYVICSHIDNETNGNSFPSRHEIASRIGRSTTNLQTIDKSIARL